MIYNSYTFWIFFACVFILYRLLRHRGQNILLLIASYFFYGYWDWRFLSLLFISTIVDYWSALNIEKTDSPRRRKVFLALSMVVNLGMLGFFKYYGFFAHEFSTLMSHVGFPVSLPILNVILPAGISFYTFQTMSYVIDVYRRECEATKNFLDFALFVTFFPHLVAGPIMRAPSLLTQIIRPRPRNPNDFRDGLYHIMIGLFKKVVIADNMAPIVNAVFQTNTAQLSGVECLIGIYAFAFQIYGDFSGYSSMAQGIAKWLGFDLIYNFKMPYLAVSPSDFWSRWHIALSSWFRDYVYIPLGGNRGSKWRTYRNLVLTTTISGLWHGAAWTFILWGLFHGLLICAYRVFEDRKIKFFIEPKQAPGTAPLFSARRLMKQFVMFQLVCFGWLLFRAESMSQVFGMLQQMATDLRLTAFAWSSLALVIFYAVPLMCYEYWVEHKQDFLGLLRIHWLVRGTAYSYFALMLWFFPPPISNVFIYFQF